MRTPIELFKFLNLRQELSINILDGERSHGKDFDLINDKGSKGSIGTTPATQIETYVLTDGDSDQINKPVAMVLLFKFV